MSELSNDSQRDHVLFEFHVSCPRPTAAQIVEWTERYPQFADDIRIHAAISRDWDASDAWGEQADTPVSDTMMARAHSRVLNALYQSETQVSAPEMKSVVTFEEMLQAKGKKAHEVASELDVGRDVLADLFNGWMTAPVGQRLADAVSGFFGITTAVFQRAYQHAFDNARVGHAKSSGAPIVPRRSYEEVIKGSNMTPERKKYWLGER